MKKLIILILTAFTVTGSAMAQSQDRKHDNQRPAQRVERPQRSDRQRVDRSWQRMQRPEEVRQNQDRRYENRDRNRDRRTYPENRRGRTPRFRVYFPRLYFSYNFTNTGVAYNQGYRDGLYAGENDVLNGRPYNPELSSYYVNSNRFRYSAGYRNGFIRGYARGYNGY